MCGSTSRQKVAEEWKGEGGAVNRSSFASFSFSPLALKRGGGGAAAAAAKTRNRERGREGGGKGRGSRRAKATKNREGDKHTYAALSPVFKRLGVTAWHNLLFVYKTAIPSPPLAFLPPSHTHTHIHAVRFGLPPLRFPHRCFFDLSRLHVTPCICARFFVILSVYVGLLHPTHPFRS